MDTVRLGPVKGTQIAVAAFVLGIVLFVVVVGGGAYLLTNKTDEGSETHEAICALTADLERRTELSRNFLRDNPHGTPGIPASTIRESVSNQERTISVLTGAVSCG